MDLGRLRFYQQYCSFICSNSAHAPGMLSDTNASSHGFFAFLRLVGCAYFRKHKSAFFPSFASPMTIFHSFLNDGQTVLQHHTTWLDFMRERIWGKIKYEEEMIPSVDALKRHWMRSGW